MTERVERLTMSVEETAQALGVSRKVVYNLIHQEGFPVLWIGRCARVNREGLRRWVDAQTEQAQLELEERGGNCKEGTL